MQKLNTYKSLLIITLLSLLPILLQAQDGSSSTGERSLVFHIGIFGVLIIGFAFYAFYRIIKYVGEEYEKQLFTESPKETNEGTVFLDDIESEYKIFSIGRWPRLALGLILVLILAFLVRSGVSSNLGTNIGKTFNEDEWIFWVGLLALAVIFGAIFILLNVVKNLSLQKKIHELEHSGFKVERRQPVLEATRSVFEMIDLQDAVPIEEEGTIMFEHAYDGIRELDNNLPPWWKYGFYLSIIWAAAYLVHYHVLKTGPTSAQEYTAEMDQAAAAKAAFLARSSGQIDETNVVLLKDMAALDRGKETYINNCMTCHGKYGEGMLGAGPNLTDEYWIHGGDVKDLFKTVKYGVTEKGMISWRDQLRPVAMQEVVSYIKSLTGTDPPNALAPQGELYKPAIEVEDALLDTISASLETDSTDLELEKIE